MPKLVWPWVSRRKYNHVVAALKLAIVIIDSKPANPEQAERIVRVKQFSNGVSS